MKENTIPIRFRLGLGSELGSGLGTAWTKMTENINYRIKNDGKISVLGNSMMGKLDFSQKLVVIFLTCKEIFSAKKKATQNFKKCSKSFSGCLFCDFMGKNPKLTMCHTQSFRV